MRNDPLNCWPIHVFEVTLTVAVMRAVRRGSRYILMERVLCFVKTTRALNTYVRMHIFYHLLKPDGCLKTFVRA